LLALEKIWAAKFQRKCTSINFNPGVLSITRRSSLGRARPRATKALPPGGHTSTLTCLPKPASRRKLLWMKNPISSPWFCILLFSVCDVLAAKASWLAGLAAQTWTPIWWTLGSVCWTPSHLPFYFHCAGFPGKMHSQCGFRKPFSPVSSGSQHASDFQRILMSHCCRNNDKYEHPQRCPPLSFVVDDV
jgi:hypothetical protein